MKLLQREEEFAWFVALLQREGVRSYLEIGSKYGASLDRIARSMPKGSRVVSVDLPGEAGSKASLKQVVTKLSSDGYDVHLVWGDSTSERTVAMVKQHGPFDAVFIDANHRLEYVTKDWENYGPMGRIVAFHDIAYRPKPGRPPKPIEVAPLWNAIKVGYRHEECCLDGPHNGIGVLWRD